MRGMGDKIVMLPLPGISARDPDFYAGPDTSDRARFAQPVESGVVLGAPERVTANGPTTAIQSDDRSTPQAGPVNKHPFKLDARGKR